MWNPFKSYANAKELGADLTALLKDFEQILKSSGLRDVKPQLELFQVAFEKRFKAARSRLSTMSKRRATTPNRELFVDATVLYFESSAELFVNYFDENNPELIAQSLALFMASMRYGLIDYQFIGTEIIGEDSRAAASIKQSVARIIEILRKKTKLKTLANTQTRLQAMLNEKKKITVNRTWTTELFKEIVFDIL